jgi:acetyltransferase-like isoleucine patch superfamily enzyme
MKTGPWYKLMISRGKNKLHRLVWGTKIHPSAWIEPSAYIDRTWPKGIHIGANCVIGSHAIVLAHDMTRGLFLDTRIGDGTVLETRSIVMPGLSIGRACVVAAGAVVTKNMPDFHYAQGNPAQIVPLPMSNDRK